MIDINEKKNKIISYLETAGPTLPIKIAKIIEMEPMFSSAILSELLNEKRVKTSFLRVGASPLYFLPGQEKKLEEHIDNLKPAEKDAYFRIKEKKILNDSEEEPAIRVALKNLKDFAISFQKDEKLFWKYVFFDEKIEKDKPIEKIEIQKLEKNELPEKKIEIQKLPEKTEKEIKIKETEFEKTKISFENISEKNETEFFSELKNFLEQKKIKFLEEIQADKKEIIAKISLESSIGNLEYLLVAKNKKSISKEEIGVVLQKVAYHKLPCIIVVRREPSKSVTNLIKENGIIKLLVMN